MKGGDGVLGGCSVGRGGMTKGMWRAEGMSVWLSRGDSSRSILSGRSPSVGGAVHMEIGWGIGGIRDTGK